MPLLSEKKTDLKTSAAVNSSLIRKKSESQNGATRKQGTSNFPKVPNNFLTFCEES